MLLVILNLCMNRKHVLIPGGGFAGVQAAKFLQKSKKFKVTADGETMPNGVS